MGFAGRHEGVVELRHAVDGVVEFPAQLAHVADPQGGDGHAGNLDLPGGQPREGLVGEVGVGAGGEDVAGPGSGDGEDGGGIGDVGDGHVLAADHVLDQPVLVVGGAGDGRVEVVAVVGETGDRHLALDAAEVGEHVDEADPTVGDGQPVGREAAQQVGGVASGHLELGEGGQVGDADPLTYAGAFGGDDVVGVGAPPRVLLGLAVVAGAFPAPDVLPLGAEGVEPFGDGRSLHGAPG